MLPQRPEADIGTVLAGKYRLSRLLGSGASGAVFEGWNTASRRRVAVKVLHANLLESEEHMSRFLREVRAAARIDHASVVKFLDAGRAEDGRPFLVQEFLYGEDMQQAMQVAPLGLPEVFEIGAQLLDALSAVHAQGLVHRDVKPGNIFLMHGEFGELRVRLVDFGIVKPRSEVDADGDLGELTESGLTVGTPHYMSPEQATGSDVDPRSDVWSTGVVLFEALSRTLPFDGPTPIVILTKIAGGVAPSLERRRADLPEFLVEVVDRALKREPAKRWQSAAEMANALKSGLRG
jgi:serine/threonine-protein kinase